MHLIMASLDAVESEDVDMLLRQPNFHRLCGRGTLVRNVKSVFVSNTYPAHTSIVTGCYPCRHGIVGNVYPIPGDPNPGWRCSAKEIRVPTLYDKAAEAGLSVCSVLFPVTEGAKKIRWNIPEIPGKMSSFRRAARILKGGSPFFLLCSLAAGLPALKSFSAATLDDITVRAVCAAIHFHRPNFTLLHLVDVDDVKHRYGPGGTETLSALQRHDERLGRLIVAADRNFGENGWMMIVFSDHGCLPVQRADEPNDFLRKKGLIFVQNGMGHYDAFFYNAGGTTFLAVLNRDRSYEITRAAMEFEKLPCVARRLDAEEMEQAGLHNQFAFGFEAAPGFCFGEKERGQHGYSLRQKDYHAFYFAVGPGIAAGRKQKGGCIVDICPLAARLLGLSPWEMDGHDRLLGEPAEDHVIYF